MAIYNYKGLNRAGKEVRSSITSENLAAAKQKIRAQGIMLVEINQKRSGSSPSRKNSGSLFNKKVSIQDLSLMTRQFATLIKARIQIVEALNALSEQVENETLRVVLGEMKNKVNEGSSLAKALTDYPKIFNNVYINMVEAGEASGTLDVVFLRLAEFTEAQLALKNKLKGALTYPIIMAFVGVILISVIFIKVVPQIAEILTDMEKELPPQTKFCIALSDFLVEYWWMVIIGAFASYYLFKKYIHSTSGERRWHALQLKFPIFGKLIKMVNISRFTSTLATLLDAGVPILASLNIVKNLVPNVHMREAIERSRENVSEGKPMTIALSQSGYYPAMVTHMMSLGEASGELEPMLKIVSENYEDQVETQISSLTSVLEPIMLVAMGLVVGFVVFSVVIPLMEINNI